MSTHQPSSRQTHRIKTDNIKQQPISPKQVRRFGWTRFIELAILLSIVIGAIWLISKMVTPQVVTVVSVIAGFLILRFIVRVILKVTFTLLSILFWLAILCAILLCMLWEAQLCKTFHAISSGGYLAYWDSHLFYFPLRALHFCFFPMLHMMRWQGDGCCSLFIRKGSTGLVAFKRSVPLGLSGKSPHLRVVFSAKTLCKPAPLPLFCYKRNQHTPIFGRIKKCRYG